MATLAARDLRLVEEFLRGLYRLRGVEPLVEYVLTELPRLVGSTQTSWNHVVPCLAQAQVTAWPEQARHEVYQAALARHLDEHPLIRHFFETADPSAFKISDFVSQRGLHNTALYDELYRPLRYEDQFAINLQPPGPQLTIVVAARDQRTFTERDRAVLNLLRPHIAQAWRQARAQGRLARLIESRRDWPATSRIGLDRKDRIASFPARAQRWLEAYFDDLPHAPGRLPQSLEHWLAQTRSVVSGRILERTVPPLVVERFGRQLIVRMEGLDNFGRTTLLLEERTSPEAAGGLIALGLTEREVQVLMEVEKGKHNKEIAAALSMEPGTVRKHLEHIYDKLGVDNRTAAVAALRRLTR